ncbi:MAG: hypothetical protein KDK00_13000 [Rhodobacteraceae bacterium]|nr:hypothetical protein [Paracoccaceae bacterium]
MKVRVIVHAGYHKTGTTSLQDFLSANRRALKPWLSYYGKADFLAAGAHARLYGQRPFPWRLWRFRRAFRQFLDGIDDAATIVLSRETFSGGMPGHRRIGGRLMTGYGRAARPLARVIVAELRRRFGPDTVIEFAYTTREREAWIASVWGHLLRSIRLTDDFAAFRARFPDLQSPADEAAAMAAYLAPIPVTTIALEDHADLPEGPGGAILDLVGIPAKARARLAPARRANSGQGSDLRALFLDLNRTISDPGALKAAKEQAMAAPHNRKAAQ